MSLVKKIIAVLSYPIFHYNFSLAFGHGQTEVEKLREEIRLESEHSELCLALAMNAQRHLQALKKMCEPNVVEEPKRWEW